MFRFLFFPISLLFCFATYIRRHLIYGLGLKSRTTFDIPVICIGNIAMGGTGKTPHTEFLVDFLKDNYKVATLSRGYKRKTSGFIIADESHQVTDIGDEPLQYYHNFNGDAIVAVDEKRVNGVEQLIRLNPDLQVVLLDDAYQHLAIKAGLYILLTDYFSPYYKDFVFPVGTLREQKSAAKYADIIVVTKCPKVLSPIVRDLYLSELKLNPTQKVLFSYFTYGDLVPINQMAKDLNIGAVTQILLLTGIVNPYPLKEYLNNKYYEIHSMVYPDHHEFTEKEIIDVRTTFKDIPTSKKAIITTQKDAMRLMSCNIDDLPIFYVPLQVKFHAAYDEVMKMEVSSFIKKAMKV